jgi:hypothetical protein
MALHTKAGGTRDKAQCWTLATQALGAMRSTEGKKKKIKSPVKSHNLLTPGAVACA